MIDYKGIFAFVSVNTMLNRFMNIWTTLKKRFTYPDKQTSVVFLGPDAVRDADKTALCFIKAKSDLYTGGEIINTISGQVDNVVHIRPIIGSGIQLTLNKGENAVLLSPSQFDDDLIDYAYISYGCIAYHHALGRAIATFIYKYTNALGQGAGVLAKDYQPFLKSIQGICQNISNNSKDTNLSVQKQIKFFFILMGIQGWLQINGKIFQNSISKNIDIVFVTR